MEENIAIFTALEGTLLDTKTNSWTTAAEAIEKIRENNIPLIICTKKTRAEVEEILSDMELSHPFIIENGAAIFIPKGYFKTKIDFSKEDDHYQIIEIGSNSSKLKNILDFLINEGVGIQSFSDMTTKDIATALGISVDRAMLAKQHEYTEAFKIENPEEEKNAEKFVKECKYNLKKDDDIFYIYGNNDLKKAVETLAKLFKKKKFKIVGIGSSEEDSPILGIADSAFVVQNNEGKQAKIKKAKAVEGIGPVGFGKVVDEIIK